MCLKQGQLPVIAYVLFNAEGAPVKQALLDAGIGEEVFGDDESHQIEDNFVIAAKYAKSEDAEKLPRDHR